MKRIDLLIQLIKNIYKLLKTHLDAPCRCTISTHNREGPFDQEEVNSIVQILKSIEKQVRAFNDLSIGYHNPKVEIYQSRELEEWLSKWEVMEYLKISKTTYYRWRKEGKLIPRNAVGEDRFLWDDMKNVMKKRIS